MIGEVLQSVWLGFNGEWSVELRFTEARISVNLPDKKSALTVFGEFHLLIGDVVGFFEQTDDPVFTFHFKRAGLRRFGDAEAMR
ncbi:hypothetical protein D0962_21335 [Leptolyngbyaceae cyanobacterium CCMR0082]|uniref:Uncharacterized protein n=1 Tax=Adonisia turfae CCMR0082 TaxID=2304604 RepID=A0A6M0SB26_9CYAN|nr:hypothetical protein [Adonisia turfae]NEZ65283.1 hypothetical protein [Adonisia turfae CCMR0082]